jgi:hypothetical protein
MATLHKFKLGENYNKNFIVFSRLAKDSLEPLKYFGIFAREQKCIINHFDLAFAGEMVVINTTFVFEKILNQCFFP